MLPNTTAYLSEALEAKVDLIFVIKNAFSVIKGWFPVDILILASSKKGGSSPAAPWESRGCGPCSICAGLHLVCNSPLRVPQASLWSVCTLWGRVLFTVVGNLGQRWWGWHWSCIEILTRWAVVTFQLLPQFGRTNRPRKKGESFPFPWECPRIRWTCVLHDSLSSFWSVPRTHRKPDITERKVPGEKWNCRKNTFRCKWEIHSVLSKEGGLLLLDSRTREEALLRWHHHLCSLKPLA